jgi:hypothetical protein
MIGQVAEFLEREAGHVLVGLALIGIGALLWKCQVPKAEDLVPFALGVIARSMVGDKTTDK